MISVRFLQQKNVILGISVRGHAQHGSYGNDVVCAAVSALLQAFELGLRDVMRFTDATVATERNDAEGYMRICWSQESGIGDSVLFQTLTRSLESVRRGYPKNLCIEEVFFNEDL
jgi:hypothetical protein